MAFKKFTQVGARSFTPKVGIWAKGQVGFNKGAVEKWKLGQYSYVVLYYDDDAKQIGVQFTNDENAEGVIKIIKRATGISFSANSFLKHFEIVIPQDKQQYDVKFDNEEKMCIIDLPK